MYIVFNILDLSSIQTKRAMTNLCQFGCLTLSVSPHPLYECRGDERGRKCHTHVH